MCMQNWNVHALRSTPNNTIERNALGNGARPSLWTLGVTMGLVMSENQKGVNQLTEGVPSLARVGQISEA
jgi:hypothetical protein